MKQNIISIVKRSPFIYDLARASRDALLRSRRNRWHLKTQEAAIEYQRSHSIRKLQIGTGTNYLEDWFNTDLFPNFEHNVFFLDATRPLLFEDNAFDYIFSEQMIEHIPYKQGTSLLHEAYRILKTGGKIRIATPDLKVLTNLYNADKTCMQQQFMKWIMDSCLPDVGVGNECFVINNAFRNWGHQFIYDQETLSALLMQTGFTNVHRLHVGQSSNIHLQCLENHGTVYGSPELNDFESLILEAERPSTEQKLPCLSPQ